MNLGNLLSSMPNGFWENLLGSFYSFIGNYGWTIIIFTIVLKLVLSPLEFWQKKSTRDNTKMQAILKPELDKIKQKYAGNEQMINQKTMELYKKNNYNVIGTCGGMLVYLVITMVVLFGLLGAMSNISYYKVKEDYTICETTYIETYKENVDLGESSEYSINIAQQAVSEKYGEIKEGWLWINNIWRPDTNASIFPKTSDEYLSLSGTKFVLNAETVNSLAEIPQTILDIGEGNEGGYTLNENGTYTFNYVYKSAILENEGKSVNEIYALTTEKASEMFKADYELVTKNLVEDYSGFNGYFILIILTAIVRFLSQLFANLGMKAKNQKGEEVKVGLNTNKFMLIFLTALMIFFTWNYSAAFALYILMNSLMTLITGTLINLILNKLEDRKEKKKTANVKMPEYSRKK